MHRLVVHAQLVLLQGAAQIAGHLNPVLGMGRQLLGVQGITLASRTFGLEQSRVGIAQQLLGVQSIAGEHADADAGADKQLMPVDIERAFHDLQHLLRKPGGLARVLTAVDQHGELITAQPGHGKAFAEHPEQTLGHRLEQQVTDVVAQAVIDDLEVIEVDHQQSTAGLVALRRSQRLLGAVGEQQTVGQVSQGIMVNQTCELGLGVLDRGDIRKNRDIVTDLAFVIGNRAHGLPLRVDLAAFAPVPDFAVPLAALIDRLEHCLIKRGAVATRLEHVRASAKHLFGRVAGYFNQGTVDVNDHPAAVADQHPFTGAVKHHRCLTQALPILKLALQTGVHPQKIEQTGPGEKNQYGAEQGKNIAIYLLPPHQLC